MKITKKQDGGISIIGNFDFKNYRLFKREVSKIIKKYESKSNVDKASYTISMKGMKSPYLRVKGWSSRIIESNGKISEILLGDYDGIMFRLLENEIRYFREKYDLPPVYIFKTKEKIDVNKEVFGNYLILCPKMMTFKQVIDIQSESHMDEAYKSVPKYSKYRTWCWRLSPKVKRGRPKFKCIIGDLDKTYSQDCSKGHLEVLKGLYPDLPKVKYSNLKGNISGITFDEYVTAAGV